MNTKKRARYRNHRRRAAQWRGWQGAVGLLTVLFSSQASADVVVTEDQARAIALRTAPGKVLRVEQEKDVIEVRIRDRKGQVTEVEVDRRSGRVLDVQGTDA